MKINKPAAIALIVYPSSLLAMLFIYLSKYGFGGAELGYLLLGYYVTNITVGIGLHRLWSHNCYKAHKALEFVLCVLAAGVMQGPSIAWASDHFRHHTHTDKELDPHTPLKYKNRIKGFLWSHIGWMLYKQHDNKMIDTVTMKKLGRNKMLLWQLKNYWPLVFFMQLVPPMLLGYALGGTLLSSFSAFLFIGLGRAMQQQVTFCVNSVCHFWGSRNYTSGTARNVWWLSILLLGENYHNFHHAFPNDYRNGVRWYEFDVHKWIIFLLAKVGLASDLIVTPAVRISAKVEETRQQLMQKQWQTLSQMYESFSKTIYEQIDQFDKKGVAFKSTVFDNLNELKLKVDNVISEIKVLMDTPDITSNQLLKNAKLNFELLRNSFNKISKLA
jgi:stearoyl-CoA desaturase (delta-9 desaturase)